jgi:hypothetical protein
VSNTGLVLLLDLVRRGIVCLVVLGLAEDRLV